MNGEGQAEAESSANTAEETYQLRTNILKEKLLDLIAVRLVGIRDDVLYGSRCDSE